jgi:hypothetical protein
LYHQYLLAAELNAVWNGNTASPAVGSPPSATLGYAALYVQTYTSTYTGTSANAAIAEGSAILELPNVGSDLYTVIAYLGGGADSVLYAQPACWLQPVLVSCLGTLQVR